ncbi:hypothetical protein PR048_023141 [Dryococelus australis]|uniref:Uncharacterized protein n=1 Tax=Dryococelus australis TaxID=614101 RepID=A0ABQ9GT85_9NEOP|nr:hypothetical protein PR048_023141 [Dryococelus australis]
MYRLKTSITVLGSLPEYFLQCNYSSRRSGATGPLGATVVGRLACSPPIKAAGSLRIFACGNRAGRCRWSAGFLGDLPLTPPLHSSAVPYSPQSPSSALKTSMLAARIFPLHLLKHDEGGGGGDGMLVFKGGGGGTADLQVNPPASGIVRHDSHLRRSGSDPPGIKGEPPGSQTTYAQLQHRGSKLYPRSDLRSTQKTVAPFEFSAALGIETMFISNRRNWRFEISIRDQQPSSTNVVISISHFGTKIDESEIHNHEISLVQRFYIGIKIKLDPDPELGLFDLGSGKMVQPGIRYSLGEGASALAAAPPRKEREPARTSHSWQHWPPETTRSREGGTSFVTCATARGRAPADLNRAAPRLRSDLSYSTAPPRREYRFAAARRGQEQSFHELSSRAASCALVTYTEDEAGWFQFPVYEGGRLVAVCRSPAENDFIKKPSNVSGSMLGTCAEDEQVSSKTRAVASPETHGEWVRPQQGNGTNMPTYDTCDGKNVAAREDASIRAALQSFKSTRSTNEMTQRKPSKPALRAAAARKCGNHRCPCLGKRKKSNHDHFQGDCSKLQPDSLLTRHDEIQGLGKREIPEKTRRPAASSGTIPSCENLGVARPGIEPAVSLLASHQGDPGSIPGRVTPDFCMWESCRTMPLVGGFSFRRCSILTSIALIGSRDFEVHGGNTARLACRSDKALEAHVRVARIAPRLLNLGRADETRAEQRRNEDEGRKQECHEKTPQHDSKTLAKHLIG